MKEWGEYPHEKPLDTEKLYVIFDGQARTICKWNGEKFYGIEDKKFLWREYQNDRIHLLARTQGKARP